jgi:N-acetylmuramoyl-L-alanine amidase
MDKGHFPRLRAGGRGPLWAVTLGFVFLAWAPSAFAVTVSGIRRSTSDVHTRVVLDLTGSARYADRYLTDPPRVVIDVTGGLPGPALGEKTIGDGYVKGVRINDLRQGSLQIVLDLEKPLTYKVFTLAKPDRIVVDVLHAGPPAPTAASGSSPSPGKPSAGATSPPAAGPGTSPSDTDPRTPIVIEAPRHGDWKIAIDAGHGGQDTGARYHRLNEKDITLDLARELQNALSKRPGITPFLVRKGDYFIPLRRRWTLAEKQGANLFVSIHCNASEDASAMGTEVFFLSLKGGSDALAQDLAERENAVDEKMGVVSQVPDMDSILTDMMFADVLTKSQLLAEDCLDNLYGLGTVYNRGVKQAGFAVLKCPRMPSILVEAAFLSNRKESELLSDGGWQKDFAKRLADGIEAYIHRVEASEGGAQGSTAATSKSR